jgi:hypothetical protein
MKTIANHHCAQILIQVRILFASRRFLMTFHPNHLLLLCHACSIKGVVGKYLFHVEFPSGQTLDSKGWLDNVISNQFFNPPLIVCQSSANFFIDSFLDSRV